MSATTVYPCFPFRELATENMLCEAAAGYDLPWTEQLRRRLLNSLPGVSCHLLSMIVTQLVRNRLFDASLPHVDGTLLSSRVPAVHSPLVSSSRLPFPAGKQVWEPGTLRPLPTVNSGKTPVSSEETAVISEETHVISN